MFSMFFPGLTHQGLCTCCSVARAAGLAADQRDGSRQSGLAVVDVANGADVHVRLRG